MLAQQEKRRKPHHVTSEINRNKTKCSKNQPLGFDRSIDRSLTLTNLAVDTSDTLDSSHVVDPEALVNAIRADSVAPLSMSGSLRHRNRDAPRLVQYTAGSVVRYSSCTARSTCRACFSQHLLQACLD